MSASAASLVYNPFDPCDRVCFFRTSKSKPSTPKPAGKRRASPLKDSPIQSDEDGESSASNYIMGETKDDKKPKSYRQEEGDIPMEQADYDRDSDSDEDKKPSEPPLEERPRQKAMPMQPPVPTLRLSPKIKAQQSMTLDEETESENVKHHHEERPPLPRRPTMKAPPASLEQSKWVSPNKPEQMGIKLLRDTANPSPFWNHKLLSIVKQYYRECRTIQAKHPEFNYVPEHLRGPRDKPCWLKTKFNDLWEPTIRGEDTQGENAHMAYIKKIYGMCC